ncbi:glycosyltransferase [Synechococcus sp. RS9902]|uniref:glycosyltransferase n=1 Tax=Synechococcus sp. RS9902 TaxID=221345 RepID=UPI0016450D3A|nr:glycosyltransferase [Synechococcus sp. RS9902]QNI97107.1 putative alpha-glycosyltransferase/ family 4 [Synechococcus sp. RS9902]
MTSIPKYKIVIIANYLPDKQESMLRVSTLYRNIVEEEGLKTKTLRPTDRIGKFRKIFPKMEKWLNYIDKFIIFSIELIGYNILNYYNKNIVYHITDHSNSIYSLCLLNKAKVITCHDVLAINSMLGKNPKKRLKFSGKLLQKLILVGIKCNHRIVCVSKKTENEIRKLVDDKNTKINTVLQPLNYKFEPIKKEKAIRIVIKQIVQYNECIENGFILHVGGNQWYKNRMGLCAIYNELNSIRSNLNQSRIPLILAGKKPTRELVCFAEKHRDLKIIFLISPTNKEINALYSLANLLLFPSIEEGFGWPIVEAMACGCPVVTTGKEPMTEAGGSAAIYIDPSDSVSAAKITNEVINWSKDRKKMQAELGFQNVKRFCRKAFAQEYRRAYEDALGINKKDSSD